jgi:hypothetical protein
MSDSKPEYFLRPEAGPVPYNKLQKRAQAALKDVIGFLSASVTSVQVSSDNTASDTNRASRIFFVSGEPGSGKSTLYLTLKEMLRDKDSKGKYSKDYDGVDLSILKPAVRWLDTLDLEVAGDEGENLLAAVLVRLIDELTHRDTGSNTFHSKPCEEAIKDLEELATDIGIAWEGNLQARAGELDPDTYSEEVMRTQRARLRINERLKKALDDLAKNGCYGCNNQTLFVLPVDDFYLKPHASLQLLRLLRMISIPRLFFLVMGDITTVEALFVEKSLADWTAVAGPEIFATLQQRQDEALGRARELRARYLRKLLPPGQRVVIEAMDWHEALRFKPERLNGKETDVDMPKVDAETLRVGYLRNLFEKENIDSKTDTPNLLTFLISPPLGNETREEIEGENDPKRKNIRRAREAYTALQILDATSREIMDLWFALYDLKKPKDAPPLLSCVLDFVQLVIEEQNFLNEKQQGVLLGILPTRHYTEQEIYLDMTRLRLQPEQNTWGKIGKDQSQSESNQPTKELWVRKHRSWKLGVNTDEGESNEDEGLFAKLPPRQTAWIILMHDLAWKWNPERVTGNLVEKLYKDLGKRVWSKPKAGLLLKRDENTEVSRLRLKHLAKLLEKGDDDSAQELELNPSDDFRGWAVWRSGEETYKHFKLPEFETFRDVDRFLFIWSSGLEWLRKTHADADVKTYINLWKLAGWTVLLDTYKDFAEEGDDWYKDFAEGGDEWFKDFMSITVKPFIKQFEKFKIKRQKLFEYPQNGDEKIKAWRKRLNDWGINTIVEPTTKFKKAQP